MGISSLAAAPAGDPATRMQVGPLGEDRLGLERAEDRRGHGEPDLQVLATLRRGREAGGESENHHGSVPQPDALLGDGTVGVGVGWRGEGESEHGLAPPVGVEGLVGEVGGRLPNSNVHQFQSQLEITSKKMTLHRAVFGINCCSDETRRNAGFRSVSTPEIVSPAYRLANRRSHEFRSLFRRSERRLS